MIWVGKSSCLDKRTRICSSAGFGYKDTIFPFKEFLSVLNKSSTPKAYPPSKPELNVADKVTWSPKLPIVAWAMSRVSKPVAEAIFWFLFLQMKLLNLLTGENIF